MNKLQQLLKLNHAKHRRIKLLDEIANRMEIPFISSNDFTKEIGIADQILQQFEVSHDMGCEFFNRMDEQLVLESFECIMCHVQYPIYIAFSHWLDAGAVLIEKDVVIRDFYKMVQFDGDGICGCTQDMNILFSVDYDRDYPADALTLGVPDQLPWSLRVIKKPSIDRT